MQLLKTYDWKDYPSGTFKIIFKNEAWVVDIEYTDAYIWGANLDEFWHADPIPYLEANSSETV